MNKKYIIAAMATSFALNMNAQSVKVTGTVVDSNNEPVIGAYIKVKGSSKGAVTDLDGHYTIDADKNATLVISYVGMANQEEKVGNRSQINFVLKDDANDLNEVVVIGYGQVKKGDLTSSISAIKGDKLEKLSTGNVMNALQGQVNGVQKVINRNTIAEFGYNEPTNRSTIKIKDKDTDEVIKEIPSEKALEMLAKAWELAGILVDEKR
jgi:uncharacterized FlaG/YvyC family protein